MSAPEQEPEDVQTHWEGCEHAPGHDACAARELTQQAQALGMYDGGQEPPASALDRVLAALWFSSGVPGLPSADILAAQRELDQLRADRDHWRREYQEVVPTMDTAYHAMQARALRAEADLADVARLEAWLREGAEGPDPREVYCDVDGFVASHGFCSSLPDIDAPSLPALGAAVATEGT